MKTLSSRSARILAALFFIIICVGFSASPAGAKVISSVQQNTTPIAKNLEYTTYKGVEIRGKLSAVDPDGDAISFEITNAPKKGAVTTSGDGNFVYMPDTGKKGQDTFSYVAVDNNGGISTPATVTIKINKQSTTITYADMSDNPSCYAALLLADKGILTGEKLGNEFFFRPDATVTRGEFLSMTMSLTGMKSLDGITRTGFTDDADIPVWLKPYVSAALMSGVITGYKDSDDRLVFSSEEPITYPEAAVIMNNLLQVSDVNTTSTTSNDIASCAATDSSDTACPVWASQAASNLSSINIIAPCDLTSYNSSLTRAQAADLLASAIDFMNKRDNSSSLLSWAKS